MDGVGYGGSARLRATRWLLDIGRDIPAPVRARLLANVYGSLTIYVGAVFNTILIAAILAARIDTPLLYIWAGFEILLAAVRLQVLLVCRRASEKGAPAPVDLYVILSLLWGAGIGLGTFAVVMSGDWVAATIAGMSMAAMLGGLSFRYFGAPRLACAMLIVSTLPGAIACGLSGEPILLVAALQMPLYVVIMTRAAWWMNGTMVAALCAEHENGHRARHDALTGLLNRTGLADAIAAAPAGLRLGCLFLDLDGFKRVNDTMGHAAGDDLLAMVAARLRDTMKTGDIFARIGGDEFLLVAPMASAAHARDRGEAMIAAVAGLPYVIGSQGVLIGASVGAALQGDKARSLEAMIAAADEALYRAKSGERCCCVVADEADDEEAGRPLPPQLSDLRTAAHAAHR
ncbi:GGDEF domain-containing protein [Sphingosinicella sp. YJ22]|uniref:GGDEF domain-containing protein n=1 Tax=Sphingosinicella sp. YJ22 TaxID=1104780 RepID=UPI0014096E09|nr:GGDEF domain-containing protein [Sphingosinicella sp. YJ22]